MTTDTVSEPIPAAKAKTSDKGRLIAFKNHKAASDNKRPAFEGELSLTAGGDNRKLALWAKSGKDGAVVLTGTLGANARDQINAMAQPAAAANVADTTPDMLELAQSEGRSLKLQPNGIILFANKVKAAAVANKLKDAASKPDYWGYATDEQAKTPYKVAAWAKLDKNGNPYLAGTIDTTPEPDKTKTKSKSRGR
ncbi:hypothetical protein [Hyphomicrobium sp. CS1BSMeth3]|uniref:hypothetical protein n=1 Tax=Hyphomicrobium sp. CS1BSMeth3 TaxID=1892844 RepID=UPI0009319EC3|nr:hypothetical protein [Hyphomicrobium sp. CS1BSMeth3]